MGATCIGNLCSSLPLSCVSTDTGYATRHLHAIPAVWKLMPTSPSYFQSCSWWDPSFPVVGSSRVEPSPCRNTRLALTSCHRKSHSTSMQQSGCLAWDIIRAWWMQIALATQKSKRCRRCMALTVTVLSPVRGWQPASLVGNAMPLAGLEKAEYFVHPAPNMLWSHLQVI